MDIAVAGECSSSGDGTTTVGGAVDGAVVDVTQGETKGTNDAVVAVAVVVEDDAMDEAFYEEIAQARGQGLAQKEEEEEEEEGKQSKGKGKGKGKGSSKGKSKSKGKGKGQTASSTKSKKQSRPVVNQALHGAQGWILVKWEGLSYSEASLEYLPDLLQWKYPTLAPPLSHVRATAQINNCVTVAAATAAAVTAYSIATVASTGTSTATATTTTTASSSSSNNDTNTTTGCNDAPVATVDLGSVGLGIDYDQALRDYYRREQCKPAVMTRSGTTILIKHNNNHTQSLSSPLSHPRRL